MSSTPESALGQLVGQLAVSLLPQGQLISESIHEHGLDDQGSVPGWLYDMLSAVRDRTITPWIDFSRSSGDDTDVFDFIRDLPNLLPVEYENNEESWMLTFRGANIEACISLEGSCYKVSEVGGTWL